EEAAALAVHAVEGVGVGVVEHVLPAALGNVGDGVEAAFEVMPEGLQIGRSREATGHPDDGDAAALVQTAILCRGKLTVPLGSARMRTTWASGRSRESSSRKAATPSAGGRRPIPRRAYSRPSSGETMPLPAQGPQSIDSTRPGRRLESARASLSR